MEQVKSINVMVDLETVGTSPTSAILSIGAVTFLTDTPAQFYEKIDLLSCYDFGLTHDESTMEWWGKQDPQVREEAVSGILELPEVIEKFADWLKAQGDNIILWGNGSDFDNVLLVNAFQACAIHQPWAFGNHRCFRTLKNLFPYITHTFDGPKHQALVAAVNQAKHAEKIFNQIKVWHTYNTSPHQS